MIRYDIFTCAQKLIYGQLSLAHGTKTKKYGKTKNKNQVPLAQKKRCWQKSVRQSGRKKWNYRG